MSKFESIFSKKNVEHLLCTFLKSTNLEPFKNYIERDLYLKLKFSLQNDPTKY